EYPSLTVEEAKKVIKTVVNVKKNLTIIAGVGRASLKETIELAKFSNGFSDAIMIGAPFYFKPVSESGLYQFFSRVLESIKCPSFLYNIPRLTGISITVELIKKLSKFNNLIGLKDSSGDIKNLEVFINQFPKLNFFSGSDALIFQGLKLGTNGGISALGNVFPKKVMSIYNSYKKNELKTAEKGQNEIIKLRNLFKKFGTIAVFKKFLQDLGFEESFVRPPLSNLSKDDFLKLKSSNLVSL
ncbi:MAG: dihydrodipicolinate synthase family protein, partial [Candidatus Helarchaeota archaeon]|nr:dihydrodipicolinate synthase family protein [Candidatus Helarchaeota archaeon]